MQTNKILILQPFLKETTMNNSTEDQPVSVEQSTAAPKSEKRAKVAKAPKRAKVAKKKKKTGAPDIKLFIPAAALTATVGGWAGMSASLATQPSAPAPVAGQIAPSQQIVPSQQVAPAGQVLRPVSIPNASAPAGEVLRQATRPEPAARTRGSN